MRSWIDAIQTTGRNLTKWEEDFVAAVSESLSARGLLSERQVEILERIYAERTP